jgi:peptidoglycan/xylan/chitin deacetylase (PgdA/CDA1 family)
MRGTSATQTTRGVMRKALSVAAKAFIGTITHAETSDAVLALTFDDGPHPEYTLRLLDVLDKYQAKATFFCVGKFAAKHLDVIRQAAEAGHVIGNHTWDHSSFPLLTHRERWAQLKKCTEALRPYESRLFRPPYGQQSLASRLDLLQQGYQVVGWTHEAGDWRLTNASQIVEQVLRGIRPGRIIVFHDRIATARSSEYFNREPMLEAVQEILARLSGHYRFVTVPELACCGQLVRENWYYGADACWLNELIEEGDVPGRQYSLSTRERGNTPFYM